MGPMPLAFVPPLRRETRHFSRAKTGQLGAGWDPRHAGVVGVGLACVLRACCSALSTIAANNQNIFATQRIFLLIISRG